MSRSAADGPVVLALDAAPGVGSVALLRGGRVVAARAVAMRGGGAPRADDSDDDPLMRATDAILREHGCRVLDLAGVACGSGPGGFTSLRIVASIAKGLAHATGCALLAGPSLAWAGAVRAPGAGMWLVTLDALRGEHYTARVDLGGTDASASVPRRVEAYEYLGVHPPEMIAELAAAHQVAGVLALRADPDAAPIAAGAAALAPTVVDLGTWEPVYGRLAEAQARWEAAHGPLRAEAPAAEALRAG